jgi:hypothetical protein
MSFIEARSDIAICNKALSRVGNQGISGSLASPVNNAGRLCNQWYKTVVRTLLEQHHFGLATVRQALVEVTNDRSAEWLAAYQPPSDMAFPVTLGPYGSGQVSYYRGLEGLFGILLGQKIFLYNRGVIYSQVSGATLEYVTLGITEADFNQTFENLVIVFLASVLAETLLKDRQLAKDLYEEGMSKLNWAIAQSLNLGQQRYGDSPTESEIARGGGAPELARYMGLAF